jgi:tRNA (guanine37-N1)-methyltransferase
MFRPPVNRAMRVLDRSFFCKTVPLSAATVFDSSNISRVRGALSKSRDLLQLPRLDPIRPALGEDRRVDASEKSSLGSTGKLQDDTVSRKCLLLREEIKHDGMGSSYRLGRPFTGAFVHRDGVELDLLNVLIDSRTWSPTINALVEEGTVGLGLYELKLNYDYWSYSQKESFAGPCIPTSNILQVI